jgi:glycosyltransferase involved in cell wall biosynthesis
MRAADADVYYYRSTSMWAGVVAEFARRHGRRSIYAGASDRDFAPGTGGQIRYARDRWLFGHALRTVDRIVVQNLQQQAACRALTGRDSIHIPSCYQLPADSRPFQDDRVLWVGTIQKHKRPELLLELARRLPQRRFVMIGGAGHGGLLAPRGFFERIRGEAAALPNVEFKGFLPFEQADAWFDRARVFVNTSLFEGMPNTFLQAWARGVPTLATVDVGAPVCTLFQQPAQAVSKLERLLADDVHWHAQSSACRTYFERNHSPESVLAQYRQLLAEMTA